ncbi:MAG: ATP-binding protein [Methylotenera sp.]|nr:ATP-binding protein [Methylotenera sp.]
MRFYYPSSFLKLLLVGFAFAILPLIWVFVNANIAFDALSKQSQITISKAVEGTRAGRLLQEQLHLMERSSRQYFVLQDEVLFNNYNKAYDKFNIVLTQLKQLAQKVPQKQNLNLLSNQISQLNLLINKAKKSQINEKNFLNQFSLLDKQVEIIIKENNATIDATSHQVVLNAQATQKKLVLQSLVLIPLALLIAAGITYLLAVPIRRMDAAIKHLGTGEYDAPIAIDGPGDLRILGQRLDWLRTELKELNQQKQQFLRHVSHELKTPLTAIREGTELLHDGIGGSLSTQQSEIITILRDNSIRLQKMIENLLNYTRIETTPLKLNLSLLYLPDIINKTLKTYALSIQNNKLQIQTDYHVDDVVADEEKLAIILDNLISNAIKYTQTHGKITITSHQDRNGWRIGISDSGPGFSKADQEKLFDPFYRGDTLHKSLISGSGLGLTIAKDLVTSHGGRITLAPSPQGAHFIVNMPKLELK